MSLGEAIEILKLEKICCDLDISNNCANQKQKELSEAIEVVMKFVDKSVSIFMNVK